MGTEHNKLDSLTGKSDSLLNEGVCEQHTSPYAYAHTQHCIVLLKGLKGPRFSVVFKIVIFTLAGHVSCAVIFARSTLSCTSHSRSCLLFSSRVDVNCDPNFGVEFARFYEPSPLQVTCPNGLTEVNNSGRCSAATPVDPEAD